jgi:hypothetical protein
MKHVKLFESWMKSASSEDISGFAGDTSIENESIFVFNAEDHIYMVLADPETCMQLKNLAEKIDPQEGLVRSWIIDQPGASFIGMDADSGEVFPAPNVVEIPEGTNIWVFSEKNPGGGAEQLGDDGNNSHTGSYYWPLKRGSAIKSVQATGSSVISIDELVDFMQKMILAFPAKKYR